MTSPWLRDYVLQELGSEIRKQGGLLLLSQHEQEQKKAAGQKQNPGGQQQQQQQQQQQKSSTTRLVKIIARSSNFNKINNSNNNNNININHGCWLLVSDGSCSVKIHFTVQALQQIYDCDNNNENSNSNSNNNDCFFGRGCCILLQKYSVEYDLFHVATATNNNSNDNNNNNDGGGGGGVIVDLVNVIANLNNIDMERYPVRLKVSSLEAKPSFNNHITISANNSNNNNNNNNNTTATRIRPVLEDIDVLYAVQYLKRQQHIQIQQGNNNNHNNNVSCGSRKSLARDWDIAFGRLSKGSFAANDGDDDDDDDDTTSDKTATTATIGSSRNLQQIIDLADKACSTDEAIRAWDIAKNEYGINGNNNNNDNDDDDDDDDDDNTGDGGIFNINVNGAMAMTTNNNKMTTNIPDRQDINKDGGHDDDDADDDEEEDHSRMYIQNVLATQEGVDENNDEDEDEELLLLETQPQPTTNTDIATAACTTPSTPPSRNAKYILDTAQSSIVETVTIMKPSIDNEKRNTNIDENIFDENEIIMQTQPTRNDGIDDATPSTPRSYIGAKQYQQKHQSLYQEKQPMQQRQDEEESSKNNTSIWESIKEQCFDESRPFLHFVPSWRIVSSGGNNNNNDIPITPNKKMISTTSSNYNNTDIGSVGSIGTNFTLSSPNPSSGAYYKKYGLARWLKKNIVVDDNNNNNSNDDDGFVNDTTTTTTTTHAETK